MLDAQAQIRAYVEILCNRARYQKSISARNYQIWQSHRSSQLIELRRDDI